MSQIALSRTLARIGAAALLLSQSPTGLAQDGADTIEEIVVQARKRSENLQEIPDSVTVFSEESIGRITYLFPKYSE